MKTTILPNGLTVIYEHSNSYPCDTMQLYVNVGSLLEGKKEKGLNHLVEHLMFKSTNKRTSEEITRDLEVCGARVNAWTSFDNVCFYFDTLPENMDKCLEIYADMLMNKNISPEEFALEKSIVCQEIAMYLDEPEVINEDNWFHKFFGWDTIAGKQSVVSKFTLSQVNEYINAYYVPQNMTISVCTSIPYRKFIKMVKKHFGHYGNEGGVLAADDWKKYVAANAREVFGKPEGGYKVGKCVKEKDTSQVQLCYGFPVPIMNPLLVDYCCMVLSHGLSSVLTNEMREKRGLCYGISAAVENVISPYLSEYIPFLLKVTSSTESENVKEFVDTLPLVMKSAKDIITNTDIERVKNAYKMKVLRASTVATHNFFVYRHPELKMKSIKKEIKVLQKLTLDDIRKVFGIISNYKSGSYNYSLLGKLK